MKRVHQVRSRILIFALVVACADRNPKLPSALEDEGLDTMLSITVAHRFAEEARAAAAQGDNRRGIESDILRLESEVPGLGGMYYDRPNQRVVVYTQSDTQHDQVAQTVRAFLIRMAATAPGWAEFSNLPVAVEIGEYAFSELVAWSQLLLPALSRTAGWLSIDADEQINRVRVTVEDESARPAVDAVLAATGVPAEAVQVTRGVRMRHLVAPPVAAWESNLRRHQRPAVGGYQIRNPEGGRCTFGWTVWGWTPDQGNLQGYLTAAHCSLPIGDGITGQQFYQADVTANDILGTVSRNPTWNVQGCQLDDGTPFEGKCTRADVLWIAGPPPASLHLNIDPWLGVTEHWFTDNRRGGWHIFAALALDGPGMLSGGMVGQEARKVGRTTGGTLGTHDRWDV